MKKERMNEELNKANVCKVMQHFNMLSVADVTTRLSIMLPEDKEMFLAKWGLLDGKYCRTREEFEEKVGKGIFVYVDWLILKANTAFENAGRFLEIYKKEKCYKENFLRKAYSYADVFVKACGRQIPASYKKITATKMVDILEKAVEDLPEDEKGIIKALNGLTEDGTRKSYQEVMKSFSDEEDRDLFQAKEADALEKLQKVLEENGVI